MESLKHSLERLKRFSAPDAFARDQLSQVIYDNLKVEIQRKQITISGSVAKVKADGATKSQIFLKKPVLLAAFNKKNEGGKTIIDIQ